MPVDIESIADPRLILLAWAAGLALTVGFVSWFRIVGPGFTWLTAGSSALVGLAGVLGDDAWWARVAFAVLVGGIVLARSRRIAGVLFTIAGLLYLIQASRTGGFLPSVTAGLAIGGVTGEMMLGHWYLIDPRLPRWALRALAFGGIAGLIADSLVLVVLGEMPAGGEGVAYVVLAGGSVLLMVAVIGALRYPAYSGVMAATGLSYLAVLTTLGAAFLGRALVAGLGPFTN